MRARRGVPARFYVILCTRFQVWAGELHYDAIKFQDVGTEAQERSD